MSPNPGPLDKPVHFTVFPDLLAMDRDSLFSPPREFADRLRDTRAPTKQMLPLFSPCSYDSKRTVNKSLRSDANVRESFCVVGDYDRGQISFDDAVAAAKRAGIACVIVTTASHTPLKPRWRCVAPLATPLNGNTLHEHTKYTSWLAGIFADDISTESYTLSQSYYIGTIDNAPDHRIDLIEGDYLDQRADLAATARQKPAPPPRAKPAPKPRTKSAPKAPKAPKPTPSPDDNGDNPATMVPADVADLLAAISAGQGSHDALITLAGKFAAQCMPIEAAEEILLKAADQRPEAGRDRGWIAMRASIPRTLSWAYGRETETRGRLAAVIASARPGRGNGNGAGVVVRLGGPDIDTNASPAPGGPGGGPPPPGGVPDMGTGLEVKVLRGARW